MTRENHRASIDPGGSLIEWVDGPPLYDRHHYAHVSQNGVLSFTADLKSWPLSTYNGETGACQMARPSIQTTADNFQQLLR